MEYNIGTEGVLASSERWLYLTLPNTISSIWGTLVPYYFGDWGYLYIPHSSAMIIICPFGCLGLRLLSLLCGYYLGYQDMKLAIPWALDRFSAINIDITIIKPYQPLNLGAAYHPPMISQLLASWIVVQISSICDDWCWQYQSLSLRLRLSH